MARPRKSLLHNMPDGKNRQLHREHRSKRGRRAGWLIHETRAYKARKEKLLIESLDEDLT